MAMSAQPPAVVSPAVHVNTHGQMLGVPLAKAHSLSRTSMPTHTYSSHMGQAAPSISNNPRSSPFMNGAPQMGSIAQSFAVLDGAGVKYDSVRAMAKLEMLPSEVAMPRESRLEGLGDPFQNVALYLEPREVLALSSASQRLKAMARQPHYWANAWARMFPGRHNWRMDASQAWLSFLRELGTGENALTRAECLFSNAHVHRPLGHGPMLGAGRVAVYSDWATGCATFSLELVPRSNGYLTRMVTSPMGSAVAMDVVEMNLIIANTGIGEALLLHRLRGTPLLLRVGTQIIPEAWADARICDGRFDPSPVPNHNLKMPLRAFDKIELPLYFALPSNLAADSEVSFMRLADKHLRVPLGVCTGGAKLTSHIEIPLRSARVASVKAVCVPYASHMPVAKKQRTMHGGHDVRVVRP
eukprot:CAMPEP_0118875910 /NCGR_PEP_ID=MMETSP1163-20130328/16808_1 /TAXON_ID=124430 /ORGANISM="Phaeomonas parva, Strain CCMP2877" /LENGTH=412 /DNA_ID=CAMNT_0006811467 /DNA_START=15 /DNA_END=1253 /DNA_ORIENTATION=+